MNSIIEKQRIILATLLFENYENRQNYINLLSKNDFTLEVKQKIYEAILHLHNKKSNIDEINLQVVIDDEKYFRELSEVVTTNTVDLPILKDLIVELKSNTMANEIVAFPTALEKIINDNKQDLTKVFSKAKDLLVEIESKNSVELVSGSWKDGLKKSKSVLTYEMLNTVEKATPLVNGFIFEQTLSVIHSKPGSGKTTLLLSLIKMMIDLNVIDEFIYFDADNPLSVLKDRLPKLEKTFGNRMTYHTHTSSSYDELKAEMQRLCLYKNQGKRIFIVVDTLGKFVKSVNDDKECKPFMDLLCNLRDIFGSTVALVHHSNKNESEIGRPVFRGSTVISGDCDFMWGLKRKNAETTIYNDKGRLEYFEKINAMVDLENYNLDLEGSYEFIEGDVVEDTTKEVSLKTLKEFLNGKEWVSMTDIKKHFKCTNKNRKSERERQEILWDLIQDNKELILWNGESKNKAKYKLEDIGPKVVEYNQDELDQIFGVM